MSLMFSRSVLPLAVSAAALAGISSVALALEDAPPVDTAQILQALKAIRDQQVQQVKASKARALQEVQAAASNPSRAAEIWEDAVRAVQFDGSSKEGAQFRDWKEKEGDALREKECLNALRLHFNWLAITLQRSAGATVKELLPAIVNHTKEATADQVAMQTFEENMKREKELDATRKHGAARKSNDDQVKRMHDQILGHSVTGSVVARWLKIEEIAKVEDKWEQTPGNVDGIFRSIILPELRTQKDPRLMEYWEMKLKQGAEAATKAKLTFEADKFNNVTRPQLLWERAQDMIVLGQRNRAINEMFAIIKGNPSHPDFARWVSGLENALNPQAVAAPTATGAVPAAPGAPGVTVPPAPARTQ